MPEIKRTVCQVSRLDEYLKVGVSVVDNSAGRELILGSSALGMAWAPEVAATTANAAVAATLAENFVFN
jgi:hypothetical protein